MTDPTRTLLRELVALRTTSESSSFEVRSQDLTTTLIVVDGVVVNVTASKPVDPLGRILVRKRLLTQEQYVDVLERMSGALALGDKIRFGEVAVELGYVKEEGVRQCLAEQLRLLASRVFQSPSPTWTKSDLPNERDPSYDVTMPVEALFLDAVRWVDDARKGALALDEARGLALRPAWPLDQIDARFDLTTDECDFIRKALGGDSTVAALLEDASIPESVDAHAVITALLATGAAITHAPSIVPLRHAASVRPAARQSAQLPDWAIDATSAHNALARIVLAKVSVPAPAADAFRAVEQQLRSEQAFQRGKELLRLGRSEAAEAELARALALKPTWTECALFAAWARHAATSEELSPNARRELQEQAAAALRDNPGLAFGYFVLGEVLRASGESDESRHHFRRALKLDPQFFAGTRMKRFGGPPASRASGHDLPALESATAPPPRASDATPVADAVAVVTGAPAPAGATTASPAAVVPVTPPAAAAAPSTPAPAPAAAPKPGPAPKARRPLAPLVLVLVGVTGAAAAAITLLERGGGPRPTPAATAPARPADSPSLSPRASAVPVTPTAASSPVASAAPSDGGGVTGAQPVESGAPAMSASAAPPERTAIVTAPDASPAIDPQRGVIVLPASAADHRVFVDGRVTPVTGSRVVVACGHREVRIGSQGRTLPVEVPCGQETTLP